MKVVVEVTAQPTQDNPFTLEDMKAALLARLDELYPLGTWPVVPAVQIIEAEEAE